MPKAEKGTPKDIANRSKAKGLQKLRFYCQMCQKQCRDANGMKCHETSEGHLRQMRIFAENAGSIVDNFSNDFEKYFLETLKGRHGVKRVRANQVYQELIADKHHIHMNSTMWQSLTVFVQYLGKKGICIVDETDRGWFVQYIERDEAKLAKASASAERIQKEKEEELKNERRMERQMRAASKAMEDDLGGNLSGAAATGLNREKGSDSNFFATNINIGKKRKKAEVVEGFGDDGGNKIDDDDDDDGDDQVRVRKKVTALDSIMEGNKRTKLGGVEKREMGKKEKVKKEKEKKEKKKSKVKSYWLHEGIIVKVKSKDIPKEHHKQKGVVVRVQDKFAAEVRMLR